MEDGFSLQESKVGIYGLGLMGGSLALALRGHCARLIGFDSDPATLTMALSKNIIDQAETSSISSLPPVDVLILATPVPTILRLIQELPSRMPHPCIVMDVGSTKQEIVNAMTTLPKCFEPIGAHPVCGREKLGLENAEATLYEEAAFVITPLERTTPRAISAVKQVISVIGAHMIEMTPEEHDRILATTSHLPFLLASALANSTPADFASLAGPGFRSTSRLAGTPAHMMMGILQSNRQNLLQSIHQFQRSLDEFESALQSESYAQLEVLLNGSRQAYQLLTNP